MCQLWQWFFIPVFQNSLDLYDEAENSAHAYARSDDNLFSDATINNNKLDDKDELRVESPGSYLAPDPDASIDAKFRKPFLENSLKEARWVTMTMTKLYQKGRQLHITLCQARWYAYNLMSKLKEFISYRLLDTLSKKRRKVNYFDKEMEHRWDSLSSEKEVHY